MKSTNPSGDMICYLLTEKKKSDELISTLTVKDKVNNMKIDMLKKKIDLLTSKLDSYQQITIENENKIKKFNESFFSLKTIIDNIDVKVNDFKKKENTHREKNHFDEVLNELKNIISDKKKKKESDSKSFSFPIPASSASISSPPVFNFQNFFKPNEEEFNQARGCF